MPDRLERSTINRVWSGVCGGLGEYFAVDPTLVRIFFVLATIFTGGLFFIVYIALVVLMPMPGRPAPFQSGSTPPPAPGETPAGGATESTQPIGTPPAYAVHSPEAARRRREAGGWILVALGIVFLLANVGTFRYVQWQYVWPIALIALGAFVVLQRSRP